MVLGGEDTDVTEDNLKAYIQALVDFILNKNTQEEFSAFEEGFKAAVNS